MFITCRFGKTPLTKFHSILRFPKINFTSFGGPWQLLIKLILSARPGSIRAVVKEHQAEWNLVVGDLKTQWDLVVNVGDTKLKLILVDGDPKTDRNFNPKICFSIYLFGPYSTFFLYFFPSSFNSNANWNYGQNIENHDNPPLRAFEGVTFYFANCNVTG